MPRKKARPDRLSRDKTRSPRENWPLDDLEPQQDAAPDELHPGERSWPSDEDSPFDRKDHEDDWDRPGSEPDDEIWDVFRLDDEPPPEPEWGDFDYEEPNEEDEFY